MAHYAKLDENNIVTDVIVIANRDCIDENGNECEEPGRRLCEFLTGHAKWKKTSYNTRSGVYYEPNTSNPSEDQSKAYRLNYAQRGMKYDELLDAFVVTEKFIAKKHPNMVMNPNTGWWGIPKPLTPPPEDLQLDKYPLDVYEEPWFWNIQSQEWVKVEHQQVPKYCFAYGELF
jgi:hypothetical protein